MKRKRVGRVGSVAVMINEAMLFLSQLPFGRLNNTLKSNGVAEYLWMFFLLFVRAFVEFLFIFQRMCSGFLTPYFMLALSWTWFALVVDQGNLFSCQEMCEP